MSTLVGIHTRSLNFQPVTVIEREYREKNGTALTDLGHALATAGKSNAAQVAYTQTADRARCGFGKRRAE